MNDDCHTLKTIGTSTAVCAWKRRPRHQIIEMNNDAADFDNAAVIAAANAHDDGIDDLWEEAAAAASETEVSHRSQDYTPNYYCCSAVTCYSCGDGRHHHLMMTTFKSAANDAISDDHELKTTTVKNHSRCLHLARTTETTITTTATATTTINANFHGVFDYLEKADSCYSILHLRINDDCLATAEKMRSFGADAGSCYYCDGGTRKFSIACFGHRRTCFQHHRYSANVMGGNSSGASRPEQATIGDRTDDYDDAISGGGGHTDESPHRHGYHHQILHTTDLTNGKNRPLCWPPFHLHLPRSNSG